jgi:cyclophilin family peptidyl-prolyl cis-trans isomerase
MSKRDFFRKYRPYESRIYKSSIRRRIISSIFLLLYLFLYKKSSNFAATVRLEDFIYLKNAIMQLKFVVFLIISTLCVLSCGKPIAQFTIQSPNGTIAPALLDFENQSQQADVFEWDFGDGTKTMEKSPKHSYKSSGEYNVRLKAGKGGKMTMSEQKIRIEAPTECMVEIETTYGTMLCLLYHDTPLHRDNFLKIADDGTLNGTLFHRVINGFMIQGGDPSSKNAQPNEALGGGDLGYTIPAEIVDSLIHLKGALCAARTENPEKRSSATQFYIVQGRIADDVALDKQEGGFNFRYTKQQREAYKKIGGTPALDRNYTVFGRVIKGLEVIDKIAAVQTGTADRPLQNIAMKVRVIK